MKIMVFALLLTACAGMGPVDPAPWGMAGAVQTTKQGPSGPHVCQSPRDRDCVQPDTYPDDRVEPDDTPAEPVDPCANRKTKDGYDRCWDRVNEERAKAKTAGAAAQ